MLLRTTWLMLALFLWAAPAPLHAETDFVSPVVTRLNTEGYSVTEIKRTWLGRILITAINETYLREIVLNRHNGEVLRDRLFPLSTADTTMTPKTESPEGTGDDDEDMMDMNDHSPDDSGMPNGSMNQNSGGKNSSDMRP